MVLSMKEKALIRWLGNSYKDLMSFPKPVIEEVASELERLQLGERPKFSRSLRSVGKKVFELKQRDHSSWYRIVYLAEIKGIIFILHCFKKKSRKTSRNDLKIIANRLKIAIKEAENEK